MSADPKEDNEENVPGNEGEGLDEISFETMFWNNVKDVSDGKIRRFESVPQRVHSSEVCRDGFPLREARGGVRLGHFAI